MLPANCGAKVDLQPEKRDVIAVTDKGIDRDKIKIREDDDEKPEATGVTAKGEPGGKGKVRRVAIFQGSPPKESRFS